MNKENFLSRISFKCFEKFIFFLTKILFNPKVYTQDGKRAGKISLDLPTIIVSNHINHIDGTIISYIFRRYSPHNMAAKDRIEQGGFVTWYLTKAKCIPIDRQTLSTDWLRLAVKTLAVDKECVAIYPEGRHGKNREILPFHSGVTTIAAMSGAQLIMVYNDGPYKLFHRVKLIVSEPFTLEPASEGLTADYIAAQTDALRDRMLSLQSTLIKVIE